MEIASPKKDAPTAPTLRVETIDSLEAFLAIKDDWRAFLDAGVIGSNLYNDPAYIESRLESDRSVQPWIQVIRRGDEIECIAPFYQIEGRFRLQLSVLKLASIQVQITKLFGDDIVTGGTSTAVECLTLVFEQLWRHRRRFKLISVDRLLTQSAIWTSLRNSEAHQRRFGLFLASPQMEVVHQIRLADSYESFLAGLSGKSRQGLRQRLRKCERERPVQLVAITTAEQVPAFLNRADSVLRNSWQGRTFGHRPRDTKENVKYYSMLADRGWLRCYELVHNGEPVATVLGHQYGGIYHYEEPGYLQEWADYSPGIVLLSLIVEDLYRRNTPKALDFGVGEAAYKRSFSNTQHEAAAVFIAPRNGWRALLKLQRIIFTAEVQIRRALVAMKLDRAVRKLLKRQR